jgi:hypothetical protein
MVVERTMAESGNRRFLLELKGREVVYGPLHSEARIALGSKGIFIDRLGLLGPFAAELPHRFQFRDLRSDGQAVYLTDGSSERSSRIVVGRAVPVINEILGILDRDRSDPLVAFPGSGLTKIGMSVRGTVLLGSKGLMLVPRAFPGIRSVRRFRHPLEHLHGVRGTTEGLELLIAGFTDPRLQLYSEDWTPSLFGDWWSNVFRTPMSKSMERLPVLWLTENGLLAKAEVHLVSGGLGIESATGPVRSILSAGVHIEVERWATTPDGILRGELRIRGKTHKIWMLGGKGDGHVLRNHLQKCARTIWRNDVDLQQWRRCVGRWHAARLVVRGEVEVVLNKVEVEVTLDGFTLHHHEPELTEALDRLGGRHVELVLESNLVKLGVRVVHQGAVSDAERDPESGWSHSQLLYPLGAGPRRVAPGQNAFDSEAQDPNVVALYLPRTFQEVSGRLVTLSAVGASVTLDRVPKLRGSILRLAMGAASSREMRLQAELQWVKRNGNGGCTVMLRFMALDEKLRSRLQREVLRFERDAIRAREVDAMEAEEIHAA